MLYDDRHDIGYFQYWGRSDHYYNGRHAPDHPLPTHHWQGAVFGMIFAQLGAMCSQLKDICTVMSSMSDDDPDLLDDDTDSNEYESSLAPDDSPQLAIHQETVAVYIGPGTLKGRRPQVEVAPLIYKKNNAGEPSLFDDSGNNVLQTRSIKPQLPKPHQMPQPETDIPPIPDIDSIVGKL